MVIRNMSALRPVYVVGAGWHRYQNPSDTHYVDMGLAAVRGALRDAGIEWGAVDQSFIATAMLGMAAGRPLLKHLGAGGQPLVHIENASASGSAAVQLASHYVGAGLLDVALVLGVDKRPAGGAARRAPAYVEAPAEPAISPVTHFALLASQYIAQHGVSDEDLALIAVKNHRNGSLNPNAQRQKERSLEEVMSRPISGAMTALQCTPIGEGAAAVIIASEDGIKRFGIASDRPVRIAASAATSERCGGSDYEIINEVVRAALQDAKLAPGDVDLFETHDAFSIEEAYYAEAAGLCAPGRYVSMVKEGCFDIGGQCAVSASGGLIAMGHPVGPTGVGQIGELALQLRGEAGARQHAGARTGVASLVGLGAVGYAHVLKRE